MSDCEKDGVLGGQKLKLPGEGNFSDYIVRGEDGLGHREVIEGDKKITYLFPNPYIPPALTIGLTPASIEKGISKLKSEIVAAGEVTKGRETVSSITSAELGINELNPAMPYAFSLAAGDAVALGNTESISVSITAEDGKTHTKSTALSRPDRGIFGAIGKDPSKATLAELQAAAFKITDGVAGELMTAMPGKYSFAANGLHWFFLVPSNWSFKMKTDLNFNPLSAAKGSLVLNPNTSFAQNYTVYYNSTPNGGTIEYQFYAFSKS